MNKKQKALVDEALKKYKIPPEYVLGARAYPQIGEVVIVTNGGKKIRHQKGKPAQFELSRVEITGEKPEPEFIPCHRARQSSIVQRDDFCDCGKRCIL